MGTDIIGDMFDDLNKKTLSKEVKWESGLYPYASIGEKVGVDKYLSDLVLGFYEYHDDSIDLSRTYESTEYKGKKLLFVSKYKNEYRSSSFSYPYRLYFIGYDENNEKIKELMVSYEDRPDELLLLRNSIVSVEDSAELEKWFMSDL